MKKILTAATSAMMFLFVGSGAVAQDDDDSLEYFPVETFACNFRDGKGPEDLATVTRDWNAWMDERDQTDYFAVTLWPNFFGELAFDVAWLGAWRDGNAMGTGEDRWMTEGRDMAARFYDVLDCMSHTQFAVTQLREPPAGDDDADDTFVLAFSNCSIDDESSFDAYVAANEEWNAYADEHGIVGGEWVMWPIWGENVDAEYHFKAVSSADDYTTMGANWQKYAEGHYAKASELFDDIVTCDSARVYTAKLERSMADDDE